MLLAILFIQQILPWALHWGVTVKRHKDENKCMLVLMSFQMSQKDQLYTYIPKIQALLYMLYEGNKVTI